MFALLYYCTDRNCSYRFTQAVHYWFVIVPKWCLFRSSLSCGFIVNCYLLCYLIYLSVYNIVVCIYIQVTSVLKLYFRFSYTKLVLMLLYQLLMLLNLFKMYSNVQIQLGITSFQRCLNSQTLIIANHHSVLYSYILKVIIFAFSSTFYLFVVCLQSWQLSQTSQNLHSCCPKTFIIAVSNQCLNLVMTSLYSSCAPIFSPL